MTRAVARLAVIASLLVAGCQAGGESGAPTAPSAVGGVASSLSAPAPRPAAAATARRGLIGDARVEIAGGQVLTKRGVPSPVALLPDARAVDFPPRDQTFLFRQALEAIYRDELGRTAGSSFVDIEGSIVWTQEYLRYRVNGCGHADSVSKVFSQIRGGGIAPVCSEVSTTDFPPRDQPFDFRTQLETLYETELGRSPSATFVDVEGDIVWTQEYLRFRILGCSDAEATAQVRDQIRGGRPGPCVDGTWAGTTSQGFVIAMTVSNNQITRIGVPVRVSSNGCTQIVRIDATGAEPITSSGFAFTVSYADGSTFSMSGGFTSQHMASGVIAYEERGAAPFCTGGIAALSWEMSK